MKISIQLTIPMIKRNRNYWLRSGGYDELFDYFQHLIIHEPHEQIIKDRDQTIHEHAEGDNIDEGDNQFQNLMPIINSSSTQSDYLQYFFSFITGNLTDVATLSTLTSFLDISKFKQARAPLMDEFSMDDNMRELVTVDFAVIQRLVNFKAAESPQKSVDAQRERVVTLQGETGVYRTVAPEYFRDNFEPDLKALLSDVDTITETLSNMESTRRSIENSRLIELTDKFEVFLEMMGKLAQIDSTIKRQIEAITNLR